MYTFFAVLYFKHFTLKTSVYIHDVKKKRGKGETGENQDTQW